MMATQLPATAARQVVLSKVAIHAPERPARALTFVSATIPARLRRQISVLTVARSQHIVLGHAHRDSCRPTTAVITRQPILRVRQAFAVEVLAYKEHG